MRIPDLLGEIDLPGAELQAARLDGDLFPLGDGFATLAGLDGPELRVAAAVVGRSPRLIAERRTAAWVWGATTHPPSRLEFCVDIRARTRPPRDPLVAVREVVLDDADVVRYRTGAVTTPLRTAVDLARTADGTTTGRGAGEGGTAEGTAALIRDLAHRGGFDLDDAAAVMDRRRNLSGKRTALELLRAALAAQPFTR